MFPPLREGKKQKVAETDNFLYVLVSGYGPDEFINLDPLRSITSIFCDNLYEMEEGRAEVF